MIFKLMDENKTIRNTDPYFLPEPDQVHTSIGP